MRSALDLAQLGRHLRKQPVGVDARQSGKRHVIETQEDARTQFGKQPTRQPFGARLPPPVDQRLDGDHRHRRSGADGEPSSPAALDGPDQRLQHERIGRYQHAQHDGEHAAHGHEPSLGA
ncbi:hypothetical protein [Bifidobacterium phasiani]|uniref:Uncharacterized protein n=1 Tax=Bifidobacterium phasiani TaxID=2834431 RepID=A0ABS6W871_9BIFI|nr:hypothetical protein [Bifidobacterium phasiani]MBW3082289.1 hypothetical protein [Bifidobacterium phasiani]